jgi:hypothetical protein
MLVFGGVTTATAGEKGRYEAIRMDNSVVVVIDTAEGHMWVTGVGESLMTMIYFGKVRPGAKMGEIIDIYNAKETHKP